MLRLWKRQTKLQSATKPIMNVEAHSIDRDVRREKDEAQLEKATQIMGKVGNARPIS